MLQLCLKAAPKTPILTGGGPKTVARQRTAQPLSYSADQAVGCASARCLRNADVEPMQSQAPSSNSGDHDALQS